MTTAELAQVLALAFVFHLPMLLYVGRKPGDWLDTAWQVSGVLVGLVIAIVIFLLQSAVSQSLRSEATFRAVLARTGVWWPVSWALNFIAFVAIVERFATSSPNAGGFVQTYTLLLFVVQVALFGFVFLRAIRIASPQGIAQELVRQFRDGVVRAVEARFQQQLAAARMLEECEKENVSFGSFLAHGWPVEPDKTGWVIDMNASLARQLNRKTGVGSHTTITAEPGGRVGPERPLAVSDPRLGPWSRDIVKSAVRVRRRGGPPQAPTAVLNDAVDLARRALGDGSNVSQELAVDLIADCFTAFHDAYKLYGVEY
jgi:hypothetical protein